MMIKAKEIPKHGFLVFFSHEQSHCGQQLGDDLNKLIVHILFIPDDTKITKQENNGELRCWWAQSHTERTGISTLCMLRNV